MRESHQCEGSTFGGMKRCIRADIDRAIAYASAYSGHHVSLLRRLSFALTPPVMCVMLHRVAHLAHARGYRRLGHFLARINQVIHRAAISPTSCVGPGLYMPHTSGIVLHAISGANLTLYYRACALPTAPIVPRGTTAPLRGAANHAVPRLGRDVTLGVFSVVYGAVVLKDRVFVGATMSVVDNLESGVNLFPLSVRSAYGSRATAHA